ncbi:hypothetical protein D3C73_1413040 [compost metagenome]
MKLTALAADVQMPAHIFAFRSGNIHADPVDPFRFAEMAESAASYAAVLMRISAFVSVPAHVLFLLPAVLPSPA